MRSAQETSVPVTKTNSEGHTVSMKSRIAILGLPDPWEKDPILILAARGPEKKYQTSSMTDSTHQFFVELTFSGKPS